MIQKAIVAFTKDISPWCIKVKPSFFIQIGIRQGFLFLDRIPKIVFHNEFRGKPHILLRSFSPSFNGCFTYYVGKWHNTQFRHRQKKNLPVELEGKIVPKIPHYFIFKEALYPFPVLSFCMKLILRVVCQFPL